MNRKGHEIGASAGSASHGQMILARAICLLLLLSAFAGVSCQKSAPKPSSESPPSAKGAITFNKDIAPIIFQNCSGCHRPGQTAPFNLLTYSDVKKRAADIVTVTEDRYMPPWLPEPGHGDFAESRRLTEDQINRIRRWVDEGAVEGAAADLPPVPNWASDWQLGQPDLIVSMPEPYHLGADGRDVYRNFVIPVPLSEGRYVRAVEFRPGNPRIVHHTFIKVDPTAKSRYLDEQDAEPGFPGLVVPAVIPDGHFLGWQPGRMPSALPEGLSFRLEPGNDLVLQMHLNRTGKPEELRSGIGLYFTDRAPTNTCFRLALSSFVIDIPAGDPDYEVEDDFVLPVDAHLLAILPHAHYLAKEMRGFATTPDGRRESLLWIKHWDFNWQSDYRYNEPIFLPKGTRLSMRFIYDNSTNNFRNPHHPPEPVTYGPGSNDEMAELWFQLLPEGPADLAILRREYQEKILSRVIAQNEHLLRKNPSNSKAHAELGFIRLTQGNAADAERHFQAAIESDPDYPLAHYYYGVFLRQSNRLTEARREFELLLQLDPNDPRVHGNLGFVLLDLGDPTAAVARFQAALRLNPYDAVAKSGLAEALKARPAPGEAE